MQHATVQTAYAGSCAQDRHRSLSTLVVKKPELEQQRSLGDASSRKTQNCDVMHDHSIACREDKGTRTMNAYAIVEPRADGGDAGMKAWSNAGTSHGPVLGQLIEGLITGSADLKRVARIFSVLTESQGMQTAPIRTRERWTAIVVAVFHMLLTRQGTIKRRVRRVNGRRGSDSPATTNGLRKI
ncbi:hypothetical protein C8Q73DRAFT_661504 [Cubamyces lactineus]|nr:hypothetical protein C8Q73DRAFT_661504 [Cubamyces lactineus]